jgi:hypothetical protein
MHSVIAFAITIVIAIAVVFVNTTTHNITVELDPADSTANTFALIVFI